MMLSVPLANRDTHANDVCGDLGARQALQGWRSDNTQPAAQFSYVLPGTTTPSFILLAYDGALCDFLTEQGVFEGPQDVGDH